MRPISAAAVLSLLLVVLTAAAVAPLAAASSDPNVTIVDFSFQPATLTVSAGDTVTWANTGMASHTTTSDGRVWDSTPIPSGGSFSFHFTTPGTFTYHCAIHPSMHGAIIVLAQGQEPTAVDGRRLSGESAATQALFRAVWADQAALEWVKEHNAAVAPQVLGLGSAPSAAPQPASSTAPTQPSMPAAPAPAAPAPAPAAPAPAPAPSGSSGY